MSTWKIETDFTRLQRRRTKIVATLGPTSSGVDAIAALIEAGADIFRLNFSHGDHASHARSFREICAARDRVGRRVAVLADLSGPKIRTGRFEGGSIVLEAGETVTVTTRDVMGAPGLIPSQYRPLARDVKLGDRILLDDGQFELRVVGHGAVADTEITCEVVNGGTLSDRKGMNLPGVALSTPSLTNKDRRDARFALDLGVDYLALSFVRRGDDVRELKQLSAEASGHVDVIAKIEKPEALEDMEAILDAADGVMVARGDLGVELEPELVPLVQDQLVTRARARHKPVIVATQMLDSMIRNPRPTRAEVSDVSHAVHSGADAVMLSGETASGAHPLEAVRMMDIIARQTEGYLWQTDTFGTLTYTEQNTGACPIDHPIGMALARSTAQLSRDLHVRAIVVATKTGASAALVSAARPAAPIIAVAPGASRAGRMALMWGVDPVIDDADGPEAWHALARRLAVERELCTAGHRILLVRGFRPDPREGAPSVTVLTV